MITYTQNWQFKGWMFRAPSFNLSILAGIHTVMDRLINNLNTMTVKFNLIENVINGGGIYFAYGDFKDIDTNTLLSPAFYVSIQDGDYDTPELAKAAVISGILAEASTRGYTGFVTSDIQDMTRLVPVGLSNAPQGAITDSPADATTNYNVITTLLGGLTGAVNTANTKQNAIATQLNSLLSELRTLGLITP